MAPGFCEFPQTLLWQDVRDHLLQLPGVRVSGCLTDDAVIGSWIDFNFSGHSFTINAAAEKFIFVAEDTECPAWVLSRIESHFKTLFDDGFDLDQHRV